jgi:hypothetical protein
MADADSPQEGRAAVRFIPYPLVMFDHVDGGGTDLHRLPLFLECLRPEPKRDD